MTFLASLSRTTLLMMALLSLVACGGGSDSNNGIQAPPPVAQAASVAVVFTDAPSDAFDEINLSIESIELLGANDPVILFEGLETINLLDLENFADLFAIADDVPADDYSKIRLRLTDIELVRLDGDGNVLEAIHPKLTGNGKLDLNPRQPIVISAGDSLLVQIDVDAKKSIHVVGQGNGGYRFRPVVFVDVISGSLVGKLVRISGEVTQLNDDGFELCQARPMSSSQDDTAPSDEQCVDVVVDTDTGVFDVNGDPATLDTVMIGDEATVVGHFATDGPRTLVADVVELGARDAFDRLKGVVTTAVDDQGQFEFAVDDGQGFDMDTILLVQVQQGTGIFSRAGEPLEQADIQPDVAAEIDGVIVPDMDDGNDSFKAALIVLDVADVEETMLTGEIMTADAENGSLVLATDAGDRCVNVEDTTDIISITNDDDGGSLTEPTDFDALQPGVRADVYGTPETDGCLSASSIIIEAADDSDG